MAKRMIFVNPEQLEALRKNLDMTPADFSEMFGHSASWYAHAVRHEKKMSKSDAISIQAKYDVDVEMHEEEKTKPLKEGNTETDQWLCEIASKLDEMGSLNGVEDKLSKLSCLIDEIKKLNETNSQILSVLNKNSHTQEKPKAFLRKEQDEKFSQKYMIDKDSFVVHK